MKKTFCSAEDILEQCVPGFHQIILSDPARLCAVSQSLCEMTGYTKTELLRRGSDRYANLVHPADRRCYAAFLDSLRGREKTASAEYRLVAKDGTAIYVKDTAVSKRQADGTFVASSVLADITELKRENGQLQFFSNSMPFGFIKYTCEKQPRVTYISPRMIELLRFPLQHDGELDYLEMYKSNIFLMIPMEERSALAHALRRADESDTPLAGEMTLLRCDGTRMRVFGWIARGADEQGRPEYQSVCIDISDRHQARRATAAQSYIRALADVYDMIFEFDREADTVRCLVGSDSPMFSALENIPMRMGEAIEKWIDGTVEEQDQETLRAFFRAFAQNTLAQPDQKPPQAVYHARTARGEVKLYKGLFLSVSPAVSLYCCRAVPEAEETDSLKSENAALRENLQKLALRFTDGIAAFEVRGGLATPLYASDNLLEFFGMTREDWLPLMQKETPIDELIARSRISMEQIEELLTNGEAEFHYHDLRSGTERRIKAICSTRSPDAGVPRHIMLYNVENSGAAEQGVSIRTFGYFDVFVGGRPIAFRNKKSKELFALLVDRRGGFVSSEEAIGFLWEDEPVSPVTLARYRKVALRLKNILEEYGVADVVETVDGKRRIVLERVRCDLYDYLSGKEEFSHLFKGSYLTNYSWGESTLAELAGTDWQGA